MINWKILENPIFQTKPIDFFQFVKPNNMDPRKSSSSEPKCPSADRLAAARMITALSLEPSRPQPRRLASDLRRLASDLSSWPESSFAATEVTEAVNEVTESSEAK